jgi:hypothetical protein
MSDLANLPSELLTQPKSGSHAVATRATSKLPDWAVGRFAVVKLWPDIKAAEDENIARLKRTAAALGLKCVEIDSSGTILGAGGAKVTKENCDFVIHLHFETPKTYDVFSFVALWNPVKFYHDWGYERFSRNLLTHDDFLSCRSTWADDQIRRLVSNDGNHLAPEFTMFHSLSDPLHPPREMSQRILFYAGINWERLGKGRSRHQELLDMLDKGGFLSIYGPRTFQNVNVWEGYQSYRGPIPFNGYTAINEIAKCGIGLVLSSEAHKESELMSNRLFETLAAGAIAICDENPFARKHFGDCLLFIDTRQDVVLQYQQIVDHLTWINEHPKEAAALASRAQHIFWENFALDISIQSIYERLPERKRAIRDRILPTQIQFRPTVCVQFLIPDYDEGVIDKHIQSLKSQDYEKITAQFIVGHKLAEDWGEELGRRVSAAGVDHEWHIVPLDKSLEPITEYDRPPTLGQMVNMALPHARVGDYVVLVAPNERLLSSHVTVQVGSMLRSRTRKWAATSVLFRHCSADSNIYHDYSGEISFSEYLATRPMGLARFILNLSVLRQDVDAALPYLNKMAMAALLADEEKICETPSTVIIDIDDEFPRGEFLEQNELAVLGDYCPWWKRLGQDEIAPIVTSLASDARCVATLSQHVSNTLTQTIRMLPKRERVGILRALLDSVLPPYLARIIFRTYDRLARKK